VTLAENQRPIADSLHHRRLVRWLGHKDEVTEQSFRDALDGLIETFIDEMWSLHCQSTVDGKGVDRVCAILTIDAETPLNVRHACLSDEKLLLVWVNDPETWRNAFSPDPTPAETHHQWFRKRLRDLYNCRLFIVETEDGIPIGEVRFEKHDQAWKIDYSLAPLFRGRGLSRPVLKNALLKLRSEMPGILVLSRVKKSNLPSCKVFESFNFNTKSNGEGRWRISVCSDATSWINVYIIELLLEWVLDGHEVRWAHDASTLLEGDLCFYLSYGKIVNADLLAKNKNNLVVHESDLPKGRGWSPLTWQVLEGANSIPLTLFEAAEVVDSGPIYLQGKIDLYGNELIEDLRCLQAVSTIHLCRVFVADYPHILNKAHAQNGGATYYRRRSPVDSQLDPDQTIREQFKLLRVSDNLRYPAWFEIDGNRYRLRIDKLKIENNDR